jgi:hypothetical protein
MLILSHKFNHPLSFGLKGKKYDEQDGSAQLKFASANSTTALMLQASAAQQQSRIKPSNRDMFRRAEKGGTRDP